MAIFNRFFGASVLLIAVFTAAFVFSFGSTDAQVSTYTLGVSGSSEVQYNGTVSEAVSLAKPSNWPDRTFTLSHVINDKTGADVTSRFGVTYSKSTVSATSPSTVNITVNDSPGTYVANVTGTFSQTIQMYCDEAYVNLDGEEEPSPGTVNSTWYYVCDYNSNPNAAVLGPMQWPYSYSYVRADYEGDNFANFIAGEKNRMLKQWAEEHCGVNNWTTTTAGFICNSPTVQKISASSPFTVVAPNFDYSLSNSGSLAALQGNTVNATITATLKSYYSMALDTLKVSFKNASGQAVTASSLNITPTFTPLTVSPTANSTLSLKTNANTPSGVYTVTVEGEAADNLGKCLSYHDDIGGGWDNWGGNQTGGNILECSSRVKYNDYVLEAAVMTFTQYSKDRAKALYQEFANSVCGTGNWQNTSGEIAFGNSVTESFSCTDIEKIKVKRSTSFGFEVLEVGNYEDSLFLSQPIDVSILQGQTAVNSIVLNSVNVALPKIILSVESITGPDGSSAALLSSDISRQFSSISAVSSSNGIQKSKSDLTLGAKSSLKTGVYKVNVKAVSEPIINGSCPSTSTQISCTSYYSDGTVGVSGTISTTGALPPAEFKNNFASDVCRTNNYTWSSTNFSCTDIDKTKIVSPTVSFNVTVGALAIPNLFNYSLGSSGDISLVQGESKTISLNSTLMSGISENIVLNAILPTDAVGMSSNFSAGAIVKPSAVSTLSVGTLDSTPAKIQPVTVKGTAPIRGYCLYTTNTSSPKYKIECATNENAVNRLSKDTNTTVTADFTEAQTFINTVCGGSGTWSWTSTGFGPSNDRYFACSTKKVEKNLVVNANVLPKAPTVSALSGACDTGVVNVSWASIPGATSYKVFVDGASVGTSVTGSTYPHTGSTGSLHQYQVSAIASTGESPKSTAVFGSAPACVTPFTYDLSNSGTLTVKNGESNTAQVNRLLKSGIPQAVTLLASATGVSGLTASVSSNISALPPDISAILVSATSAVVNGTYPITITAKTLTNGYCSTANSGGTSLNCYSSNSSSVTTAEYSAAYGGGDAISQAESGYLGTECAGGWTWLSRENMLWKCNSKYDPDKSTTFNAYVVQNTLPSPSPTATTGECSSGLVTVSWSPVKGAVSYKVYVNGIYKATVTSTSYAHNVPSDNSTYKYRVSAVNGQNNESALSTEIVKQAPTLCPTETGVIIEKKTVGSSESILNEFCLDDVFGSRCSKVSGATRVIYGPSEEDGEHTLLASDEELFTITEATLLKYCDDKDLKICDSTVQKNLSTYSGEGGFIAAKVNVPLGKYAHVQFTYTTVPVPANLSVAPGSCSTGAVTLSWTSDSSASYYKVYVDDVQKFVSIEEEKDKGRMFATISGLGSGALHKFEVSAVNVNNLESEKSLVYANSPSACGAAFDYGISTSNVSIVRNTASINTYAVSSYKSGTVSDITLSLVDIVGPDNKKDTGTATKITSDGLVVELTSGTIVRPQTGSTKTTTMKISSTANTDPGTYKVTIKGSPVTGTPGDDVSTYTISVSDGSAPSCELNVTPNVATYGTPLDLEWLSKNAYFCEGTNFETDDKPSGAKDAFTTATSNKTYSVTCYSNTSPKTCTSSVDVKVMPETPVLTASTGSQCQTVSLSWPTAKLANGYRLYRSLTSNGTWGLVVELSSGSNSFIDGGVAGNQRFYYKLEAYNDVGSISGFADTLSGAVCTNFDYVLNNTGSITVEEKKSGVSNVIATWNGVGQARQISFTINGAASLVHNFNPTSCVPNSTCSSIFTVTPAAGTPSQSITVNGNSWDDNGRAMRRTTTVGLVVTKVPVVNKFSFAVTPGVIQINKGDTSVKTQKVFIMPMNSVTPEKVTLSVDGFDSALKSASVVSGSNFCTPTTSASCSIDVSVSAPASIAGSPEGTDYRVELNGASPSNTASGTLIVRVFDNPPPPSGPVSCAVNKTEAVVGEKVRWVGQPRDGASYVWGGDAPLYGKQEKDADVVYSTPGVKSGTLSVNKSSPATSCSNTVIVKVAPGFGEF